MRSGLPSTLVLVLVLVLAGLAGAVGTPATASATDARSDTLQETPSTDGSRIELSLAADGSARWVVEQRFVLDDANDMAAFERLADEYEAGETGVGYLDAFDRGRVAASNATGREMTFENVTHDSRTEPAGNVSVGVLELSFTWTNFARVGGGVVQVDDAFRPADGGAWFPGITETETFVVRPPDGYGVSSAPAATNQGVLRWDGPEEFEAGYLDIAYERLATPTRTPTVTPTVPRTVTPTVTPTPGTTPTDTVPPEADRETLFLLVGLVGLGGLAVLVYLLARRRTGDDDGGAAAANGGTDDGTTATAGTDADEPDPEPEPMPVDTELLSDEERVEHLLERNGGRMKQADIVNETGWSNAKVSQLLSAMDDEDRINKLRIGPENLISLPDEDVTGVEE